MHITSMKIFFSRVGAYILNTKIEKPEDKFAPTDKAAITLGKVKKARINQNKCKSKFDLQARLQIEAQTGSKIVN